jgi:murein DD-endopeptidase MepM/ murein hydrolase activator NlpD
VELASLPDTIRLRLADSITSSFHYPARGAVISGYGPRGRRNHNGTDIQVTHGQPIFAAFDGMVRYSRWNSGGFGNIVIVRHPSGLETYYAHLSRRAVAAGEFVRAGQVIGYGGRTGRARGNHLHFETRYADQSFDAERLFDFRGDSLLYRDFALAKEYFSIHSRAFEGIEQDPDDPMPENMAEADGDKAAKPATPSTHKVRGGENLWTLARRYGTTVTRLCELNNIQRNATLKIGKVLKIK